MPKYIIFQGRPNRLDDATSVVGDSWILQKEGKVIATFHNDYPNNRTNAQKVCDLLNEVSRSHGKYP